MNKHHLIITMASAILLCLSGTSFAQTTPRPEYPRPQFERADWQNLNGIWTYTFDFGRSGMDRHLEQSQGFDGKITVPFCPESALSGVRYTDFINTIWYQRTLEVPASWSGKRTILHFGAVDYETTIFIDGKRVTTHYGSGSSFAADITDYVTPGTPSNLVLCVNDNIKSDRQPCGKQSQGFYSRGCCYTRVTGIWQTVWMEPVTSEGLKQVTAVPDIDQQQLVITPEYYQENPSYTLTVEMNDGKKTVASATVKCSNHSFVVLPVKNPKLWSPESPFLYDLKYTVKDQSGNVVDQVNSYAGMRKAHVANGYFYLNNQPYFQRLVLDQGFYPEGIWTAPSDEALKHDIEMSKAVGFNGARLHQKVFEERYYYWADKLGYLTWGEQGNWGMDYNNEEAARNFISEWTEIVVRDRNHPSIVTWTPFNETWSAEDTGVYARMMRDVYAITKAIDPTRPINDASGDGHIVTDIWSVHNYARAKDKLIEDLTFKAGEEPYRNQSDKDFLAKYAGQPYIVDEFGGLPWIKESERATSWGYGGNIDSKEEFYRLLEDQIDAFIACKHVVGYCYTQITDVEQEKNGIYEYDRTPKFDAERLKSIFAKIPSIIENPQDLSDWKSYNMKTGTLSGALMAAPLLSACTSSEQKPTWSEEFESDSMDQSVWSKIPRGGAPWCCHMSDYDDLYQVKDGKMILKAVINPGVPGDTASLLTGGIWTKGKQNFGYGRLEICAKLEGTGGGWPAIWMMPATDDSDPDDPFWKQFGGWRNYGELDICERLNFDPYAFQTIHTTYNLTRPDGDGDPYQDKSATGAINPDDFNVFAVEHYRDSIKYFINGVNTLTYRKMENAPDGTEIPVKAQWTFDREFYLFIDMQVGASWPGPAVLEDLPSQMEVDWVRFYEFK